MLKTEHQSYVHGISGELQTGIGRAINPAWMQDLQAAFEHEAPEGVVFIPRTIAGIQYIPAQELSKQVHEDYRGEQTELAVAGQIRWLIKDLIGIEELNRSDTYSEPLLRSDGVRLSWRRAVPRVDVSLEDKRNDHYPEGFLGQGERAILRNRLGISSEKFTPPKNAIPTLNVTLGLVEGEPEKFATDLVRRVNKYLLKDVKIMALDITRL